MKSHSRISPNNSSQPSQPQPPKTPENSPGETLLDADLRARFESWNAEKCRYNAHKFNSWAEQLIKKVEAGGVSDLEPDLQVIAGDWPLDHCRVMADKMQCWVTELRKMSKRPVMCEPALEKLVTGFTANQRREMAALYERWARQLSASADLLEKFEAGDEDNVEIVFPSLELQEKLEGRTRGECLKFAADLEAEVAEIRRCVGCQNSKVEAPARLLAWPSN